MELIPLQGVKSHRPTLVYFPGMDGTGKLFYRQQRELGEAFNLFALTLPPRVLPKSWEAIAEKIHTLLRQTRLPGPLYFCGESFGGCMVLALAQRFPQWKAQLILVNPAVGFGQWPWLGWGIPLHQWLPNPFYGLTTLAGLPFLAALDRLDPGDRRQLLAAMRVLSPPQVAERLALLQQFTLPSLPLSQPSLIIASGGDRLLPSLQGAKDLQRYLPRSQVYSLPHSGHACLLEKETSLRHILATHGWLGPKLDWKAEQWGQAQKIAG